MSDTKGLKEKIMNIYNDKERSLVKNDKKVTYSKGIPIITGALFILTLIVCIILSNFNKNVFDTTVMVTSISVTGAIFGSSLIWYFKKAGSENQYKLRMSMYEDVVNQRLYFTEEMLKLRIKYGASEDDIAEIDAIGEIDDLMEETFQNMNNKMNQEQDEFETPNDLQNFNL
ncbi:MAG: hypothetical protein IKR19_08675 [Acholeplasmatales bacterium]|nr:hypothetical protein [Acholeplasmatales bacterium]